MTEMENKNLKKGSVTLLTGCGNNCIFCANNNHNTLFTDADIRKNELKIYKTLLYFKKIKVNEIYISGNDPIEYKRIIPLIKYIKELGFGKVVLGTHGRNLSDLNFTKEIIDAGVDSFTIPLYGSNSKIHDSITRSPGSFDETVAGMKNVISLKKNIYLSSLVLKSNAENIPEMILFAGSIGIKGIELNMTYLTNESVETQYIPLKELSRYIKPIYIASFKTEIGVSFMDFPYCLFGEFSKKIINNQEPYNRGYVQPSDDIMVKLDIPNYRHKIKQDICASCKVSDVCCGFFSNDVKKYGVDGIKPLSL